MGMVKVKAKNFGTVNSAVDGSILHFNPKGSDKRAREREVDERDVQRLVDHDLIEAPKGYSKSPVPGSDELETETLGEAAGRKVKEGAAQVDEGGEMPSGVTSRDTVAFQDPGPAGADGISAEDPDAPPPAARPAAPKAPAKTAAKHK